MRYGHTARRGVTLSAIPDPATCAVCGRKALYKTGTIGHRENRGACRLHRNSLQPVLRAIVERKDRRYNAARAALKRAPFEERGYNVGRKHGHLNPTTHTRQKP